MLIALSTIFHPSLPVLLSGSSRRAMMEGTLNHTAFVMVVEGNPDEMCIISDTLQKEGMRVLGYLDPDKAVERLGKELPHLIITDIHLPKDGGIELMKKVRADERTRSIPLVALISDEAERQSADADSDAVIGRPFGGDDLLKVVKSFLERKP